MTAERDISHTGDLTGRLLGGRYEFARRLGEGGMGVVYQAHDTQLGRTVAVKVFRDGATEVERTASETQLLASLNHPALVTVYDAHIGGKPRYLVMEYVDGPTLQARLHTGPLSHKTAVRIARDLAEGLHAVHSAGIVHRDVKPGNVLLRASSVPGEEFRAKLADFGIAHLIDSTRLTTPGTIIGSAAYLSPEQVTGAAPQPASDIYALGLVMLEALTGERAFAHDGLREAIVARLAQDPVIPSSVGGEWAALLLAMTAREPADRPSAIDVVLRVGELAPAPAVSTDPKATVGHPAAALRGTASAVAAAGDFHTGSTRAMDADAETAALEPTLAQTAVLEPQQALGRRRRRPQWLRPPVIAAISGAAVILLIGAVALWNAPKDEPSTRPALPALEEPLAAHMQQLLDAVSP